MNMFLKDFFRFRMAMISIRLNNAIPLTYSLAEQISNSLRYVSMDLNFLFSEYRNPKYWHTLPI